MPPAHDLDLVCIGRTCVDLYGQQIGAPLESVQSFQMYVGGSASNVCIGAARLGLRSAMIARVGDDPLGRFVRSTFFNEGVDVSAVRLDPERLTGLITLAIRKTADFPRVFYYDNAADLALGEDDIDAELVSRGAVLLVTGTHFSRPNLAAASRKAMRIAKESGGRIVFDIDFRPVLWGLADHSQGQQMYVPDEHVSRHLQSILPDCDLVVGTKEELCIVGGSSDIYQSIKAIRSLTSGAIVYKRGAQGSMVYTEDIDADLESGITAPPFTVEVLNSTGAGDAYLAGFLSGWGRRANWHDCCRFGNACGALVVSRHACSAAMPSRRELDYFLSSKALPARIWEDQRLERIHWATRRKGAWPELLVLAFDHRTQFAEVAKRHGRSDCDIRAAKLLIGHAWRNVARRRPQVGAIIDGEYGSDLLEELTGSGRWLARPIEQAGVTPLKFIDGRNLALTLQRWPQEHTVKCLVRYDLNGDAESRATQDASLLQLFEACRQLERELLLELLPTQTTNPESYRVAAVIHHLYSLGIFPDWWKIKGPPGVAEWQRLTDVIASQDADCRGVLLLGKGAAIDALRDSFRAARGFDVCRGFAVGRSIFQTPLEAWFAGGKSDQEFTQAVADNFQAVIDAWDESR